eukprot:356499-Chlamydomonas_euryale.AAC.5
MLKIPTAQCEQPDHPRSFERRRPRTPCSLAPTSRKRLRRMQALPFNASTAHRIACPSAVLQRGRLVGAIADEAVCPARSLGSEALCRDDVAHCAQCARARRHTAVARAAAVGAAGSAAAASDGRAGGRTAKGRICDVHKERRCGYAHREELRRLGSPARGRCAGGVLCAM